MNLDPLTPTILFEDSHLLVIDKPAGLLSQGEHTGDKNLVDWLRQYLGRPYVGLVHRLDRNTSGVLVVAKRTKSASRLTDSLQAGRLERTYRALIEGKFPAPTTWKHYLKKDEARNVTRVVRGEGHGAKEAVLSILPLGQGFWQSTEVTLVELRLETGRSHQIRVQSAHERHPLLGDAKYGSKAPFGRPALHSHHLRFDHPMSHEWIEFTAPLPPDMASVNISLRATPNL